MVRGNNGQSNTNTNTNGGNVHANNTTSNTKRKKEIDYQGRIVLDFSPEEIKQIKQIMEKEHIPFKKTMVYIMIKKYLDMYEAEHQED